MALSPKDVTLFYTMYHALLAYTSREHNLVAHIKKPEDVPCQDIVALVTIREYLYDHPDCFDEFLRDTPDFPAKQAKIVRDWKQHFVRDTFYVVKHTTQYSEFATDSKTHRVYAVQSLVTPLRELIPETPFIVGTVLLPFQGGIVYDGLFSAKNVYFGGRMAKSIKMESERDKSQYGLIRTLPPEETRGEGDATALLEFYCKSRTHIDEYHTEIWELLHAHPALLDTYFQRVGKLASRGLKKDLKDVLRAKMYCAVYKETIVACGSSQEELNRIIEQCVAPEYRPRLYTFEVRPA